MADKVFLILPFVFGAVAGSFLNVCIYRIPLGISVVHPPSRCPSCGSGIPFYYNIPVIGYMMLRGRCASCKAPISAVYPVTEALTGVLAALLFLRFGLSPELFVYFAFLSALIVITFIDLRLRIIPDVISLPGIALGFIASFFLESPGVVNSGLGILLGGGALFGIAAGYHFITGAEGMGGGDIKLLAMIGAFAGWKGALVALMLGSFLGAFIGLAVILAMGKGSRFRIPFGPFLAFGAVVHLFYGDALMDWYINAVIIGP
ncbi:MAG: prepilin peptidase [Deltaproteobacteria bacterium]|nr:prepilin peptidase [Deltaproteobacteria bacterium]